MRHIAALEPQAMALVETVDGQVTAWDLSAPRSTGLRIEGAIDWPWAAPVAALTLGDALEATLEGSPLPLHGVAVIHSEGVWSVGGLRGGIQVQPADVELGLAEGEALISTLEPGQTRVPRAPLLRSAAWRGIVWPPSGPPDAGASALSYLAMTPLPRDTDDEGEAVE